MHRDPYAFVETLVLAPAMRAACFLFFWGGHKSRSIFSGRVTFIRIVTGIHALAD